VGVVVSRHGGYVPVNEDRRFLSHTGIDAVRVGQGFSLTVVKGVDLLEQ
jgi:hypothetical protein